MELLGYASAEDYLYLVYEYVSNGSLGDHLHDPLLKGIHINYLIKCIQLTILTVGENSLQD